MTRNQTPPPVGSGLRGKAIERALNTEKIMPCLNLGVKSTSPIKESLQAHGWAIKNTAVLSPEMIYSRAFNTLSPTALRVLIRLLQKRHWEKTGKRRKADIKYTNNGLIFTYAEAACFGIPHASFNRAIKELVAKGFLVIEHQGGSFSQGNKDPSIYGLVGDFKHYGTDNYKPREKPPLIRYSRGFTEFNEKRKTNLSHSRMTVDNSQL